MTGFKIKTTIKTMTTFLKPQPIELFQSIQKDLYSKLRNYQKQGIDQIDKMFNQGVKSILRQAFTGTGKSVEQNYLAVRHVATNEENCVLFLTHREELLVNLADYFSKNKIYISFFRTGSTTLYNTRIFIASVDTLQRRLDKLPKHFKPNLILVEECHHSPAKSWQKIFNHFPEAKKIGFSATPERLDGKSFHELYEHMITGNDYKWYVDNHYLAPFQIIKPAHFANYNFKLSKGDYDAKEQEEALNNDVINADAVETWAEFTPGLKTVVFCATLQHSKDVAKAYNAYGNVVYGKQIAEHLDGTTDKKYRSQCMERFKLPADHPDSLLIITNFNLISEGVNVPSCSVTQWLRKTASEIFYDQGNGRSNRYETSKIQYIIDHVGNTLLHGYPDRIRLFDLKGAKERALEKKYSLSCPLCEKVLYPDYRKLLETALRVECKDCGVFVEVPKTKKRGNRQEKEIDNSIQMILDECTDTREANLYNLFKKLDGLKITAFFDRLNKIDSLTLDDYLLACEYRQVSETNAYGALARKANQKQKQFF